MSPEETAMTYIRCRFRYILCIILPGFIYSAFVRMNLICFAFALWILTVVNGKNKFTHVYASWIMMIKLSYKISKLSSVVWISKVLLQSYGEYRFFNKSIVDCP